MSYATERLTSLTPPVNTPIGGGHPFFGPLDVGGAMENKGWPVLLHFQSRDGLTLSEWWTQPTQPPDRFSRALRTNLSSEGFKGSDNLLEKDFEKRLTVETRQYELARTSPIKQREFPLHYYYEEV